MNHRITVKNLGPIKEITDFEVRRVNAVIGKSATGKSLLAKAIYCFNSRDFVHNLITNLYGAKYDLEKNLKWAFDSYKNFSITYYYTTDYYISVEKKESLKTTFSKKLDARIEKDATEDSILSAIYEIGNIKQEVARNPNNVAPELVEYVEALPDETVFPDEDKPSLRKELGLVGDTIFIPATRSFVNEFDNLRLKRFSDDREIYRRAMLSSEIIEDDMMLTIFSDVYRQRVMSFSSLSHPLMQGRVEKVHKQVLKFIADNSDQVLDISEISSGQQSMFPILMILQFVLTHKFPRLLIIEEPEENIYPEDQKKLLDYIIEVANATGSSVFLTTHSPYVLMAMNNLMEAKSRGYPKLKDRFVDIKETTVAMLKDGTTENLIDPEDELIDLNPIESVDDRIIDEFHKILSNERK